MSEQATALTPEDVDARVEAIESRSWDFEWAHGAEDALHRDVLRAIAAGSSVSRELATRALRTVDIDFARYCA